MSELSKRNFEEMTAALNSGLYPVSGPYLFDAATNVKLSDLNKDNLEYFISEYEIYLEEIKRSIDDETLSDFLSVLKDEDIVSNQVLEHESPLNILLAAKRFKNTAIDYLIENKDGTFTEEEFVNLQKKLLEGTSSSCKSGLRTLDDKYVGYYDKVKHERVIKFFPARVSEMSECLTGLVNFNNDRCVNQSDLNDAIVNSIILHGLVAGLQLFGDGNTRFGRILQTCNVWRGLNDGLGVNVEAPSFYTSKDIATCYNQYRGRINNLVVNHDNAAWNDWIKFNLNSMIGSVIRHEGLVRSLKLTYRGIKEQ